MVKSRLAIFSEIASETDVVRTPAVAVAGLNSESGNFQKACPSISTGDRSVAYTCIYSLLAAEYLLYLFRSGRGSYIIIPQVLCPSAYRGRIRPLYMLYTLLRGAYPKPRLSVSSVPHVLTSAVLVYPEKAEFSIEFLSFTKEIQRTIYINNRIPAATH